jgi:hypothetical protein
MELLKLSDIRLDGKTQFRKLINEDRVKLYKERMLEDESFPPIQVVFDGTNYWMWDGFHRYFAVKSFASSIEAVVTLGTQKDAIRLARGANGDHGLERTDDEKRAIVLDALDDPDNEGMSAREIARQCRVSHTLVLKMQKPEKPSGSASTPKNNTVESKEYVETDPKPPLTQDFAPSEEELEANQRAIEADITAMNKLLESDDALATAHEEIKRLNLAYANLESRFNSLMREKDKAVELLQKSQRELDRIKKAKK